MRKGSVIYYKYFILFIVTLLTIITLFLLPYFPQDINYYHFTDRRSFFGISYFINDFSNFGFIIMGYLGLLLTLPTKHQASFISSIERWPYIILSLCAIATGIGAGYYHIKSNNFTLFMDRLPMSIITICYLSAIFMERVNKSAGIFLLSALILINVLGTLHWENNDLMNQRDLRLYGWIQFYPISMILLMLYLFPANYTGSGYILESVGWYALSKLSELFDNEVYAFTLHIVSGHTLKHLTALIGVYAIVRYLKHRKAISK